MASKASDATYLHLTIKPAVGKEVTDVRAAPYENPQASIVHSDKLGAIVVQEP